MALATFRNNDTGDLLQLSEDWLTRFPKDPYTLVSTDELAKLEAEQRQADVAVLGAQKFDQGEDTPEAPTPTAAAGKTTDEEDTPAPPTDPRDARRF